MASRNDDFIPRDDFGDRWADRFSTDITAASTSPGPISEATYDLWSEHYEVAPQPERKPMKQSIQAATLTIEEVPSDFPTKVKRRTPEAVAQAVIDGAMVVHLRDLLSHADEGNRASTPRLAVAPQWAKRVVYDGGTFSTRYWFYTYTRQAMIRTRATSPVPTIPERYQDQVSHRDLIVFEPSWEVRRQPEPVDPALLGQIYGEFYEVKALWDITGTEWDALRSSIEQRANV